MPIGDLGDRSAFLDPVLIRVVGIGGDPVSKWPGRCTGSSHYRLCIGPNIYPEEQAIVFYATGVPKRPFLVAQLLEDPKGRLMAIPTHLIPSWISQNPSAIARQKMCAMENGIKMDYLNGRLAIYYLFMLKFPHSLCLVQGCHLDGQTR